MLIRSLRLLGKVERLHFNTNFWNLGFYKLSMHSWSALKLRTRRKSSKFDTQAVNIESMVMMVIMNMMMMMVVVMVTVMMMTTMMIMMMAMAILMAVVMVTGMMMTIMMMIKMMAMAILMAVVMVTGMMMVMVMMMMMMIVMMMVMIVMTVVPRHLNTVSFSSKSITSFDYFFNTNRLHLTCLYFLFCSAQVETRKPQTKRPLQRARRWSGRKSHTCRSTQSQHLHLQIVVSLWDRTAQPRTSSFEAQATLRQQKVQLFHKRAQKRHSIRHQSAHDRWTTQQGSWKLVPLECPVYWAEDDSW